MNSPKKNEAVCKTSPDRAHTNGEDDVCADLFNNILKDDKDAVAEIFRNPNLEPWVYKNTEGFNAIQTSCFHDKGEITKTLVAEMLNRGNKELLAEWLNEGSAQGFTPIHYASYRGNIEILKLLVENGADVNKSNSKGLGVMHLAAQGDKPNSLLFFKEFFDYDYNKRDELKSTPLHWAVYASGEYCVQFLLTFDKIDINAKDNDGSTPLHLAVLSKKLSVIKKLLQHCADKTIKDSKGRTPYDLSKHLRYKEISQTLSDDQDACDFCVMKPEINKDNNSLINVFVFFLLNILMLPLVFFLLLPFVKIAIVSYSFLAVSALSMLFYLIIVFSDPGIIKNKDKVTFKTLLDSNPKVRVVDYCHYCVVKKTTYSKHCLICNNCVNEFDHHCFWTANCIGKKNIYYFYLFIFFLMLTLIFNIFLAVYNLALGSDGSVKLEHSFPPIFPKIPILYDRVTIISVSAFTLILSGFFLIPIVMLCCINMQNCYEKLTIKRQNTSFENRSEYKGLLASDDA